MSEEFGGWCGRGKRFFSTRCLIELCLRVRYLEEKIVVGEELENQTGGFGGVFMLSSSESDAACGR